jgi:hypothetical protein
MPDDRGVARATAHYPAADITPAQFEQFVVDTFQSVETAVDNLKVELHDKIVGVDGEYDFDATVRFSMGGMNFLVFAEAKRHKNPVKRELVQVLNDKLRSVGAQKAVMISTAPYQSGALEYPKVHGIALVTVTEGRFRSRWASKLRPPSHEAADTQVRQSGASCWAGIKHQSRSNATATISAGRNRKVMTHRGSLLTPSHFAPRSLCSA